MTGGAPCNYLWRSLGRPRREQIQQECNNRNESEQRVSMGCPLSKNTVHNGVDTRPSLLSTSSASDEDAQAIAEDLGRQTVSNADLINVQRQEKTDVSVVLENRWLRQHFSEHKELNSKQKVKTSSKKNKQNVEKVVDENGNYKLSGSYYESAFHHQNYDCDFELEEVQLAEEDVLFKLDILHFNDVYELTERNKEPVGGAARFASSLRRVRETIRRNTNSESLCLFSGDCLNPSTLSSATKGQHMVEVLDYLNVTAAVFGNHEFDFGVEHAARCAKEMNFPWLLSNVIDLCTGRPLGDGVVSKMIEWNTGVKIGLVGLIEEEWLDTLATVDKSDLAFEDFVKCGERLCGELRKAGANIIIALTHMRWPNDIRLANEVVDIDLILGGHDHEYGVKEVNGCVIVKSGSDFRQFSQVSVYKSAVDGTMTVGVTRHDITRRVLEDKGMKEVVNKYMNVLDQQLDKPIGRIGIDLDGRYSSVRYKETNLGNFVADIMRMATKADVVLINSGTFRSNAIHSAGEFKVRDLMTILPIHDTVVLLEVTGAQLVLALENAVSKFPQLEGRFPQISGFVFAFDKNAPPFQRVIVDSISVNGQALDNNKVYRMATKAYVARGRDGYTCLKKCEVLSDPDSGPLLSTVVRNHVCSVHRMMEYEETRGCKIVVSEDGRRIAVEGSNGSLEEALNIINREEDVAPVDTLRESMEKVMQVVHANIKHRSHLMQSLVELSTTEYHVQSIDIVDTWRACIENTSKKNQNLLEERSKSPNDIKWQITPLTEARIFFYSKTFDSK